MDYQEILLDFAQSPTLRLIGSDNAPLIISFLYQEFKKPQRLIIPYEELLVKLEGQLEDVREDEPAKYPRASREYLHTWSDDQHRYLRSYTRANTNEFVVELTPETERVLSWFEELQNQDFVGTESRFLNIFSLLEQIVTGSTEEPATRLAQLEKQRDAIEQEIQTIRETGQVERYSQSQVKERFLQARELSRQLLRDFSTIEQRFRQVARTVQEAQLAPGARKGDVVGTVLDAEAKLKGSDEGQSFYAFWQFLLSPSRQDQLREYLDVIYELPELSELTQSSPIPRRLTKNLLEGGEKIVSSNSRLAEQLRRMLDEQNIAESQRVRELINQIKQKVHKLIDTLPEDDSFVELEGAVEVRLVMERELWERPEPFKIETAPQTAQPENLDISDLSSLYSPNYIDEQKLKEHIEELLELQAEVSLGELIEFYPLQKGLSEIVAYLVIAFQQERHQVRLDQTEKILMLDEQGNQTFTVPKTIFRRMDYQDYAN